MRWECNRAYILGLRVASTVSEVTKDRCEETLHMARAPSPKHIRIPRPAQQEEQRPVLQLPLARPQWREPKTDQEPEVKRERGIAVVDFYI